MAFGSATHDIAADGFYMLGLDGEQQSFFSGIRSIFYRLATIFGQGGLIIIAGKLEESTGSITTAWSITFAITATIMLLLSLFHKIVLPTPANDISRSATSIGEAIKSFGEILAAYFKKPGIVQAIMFMLLFRLPEAQLVKLLNPFLLDSHEAGGLARH